MKHFNISNNAVAVSIVTGLFLAACSPQSAPIAAEKPFVQPAETKIPTYAQIDAQKFDWVREDGGQSQLNFNPQVDILFVTDNSDSMKSSQENLSKNIERFSAGIVQNKMIDYHIGVISVWDMSDRFIKTKKDSFGIGELRYAKSTSRKNVNQRYVTKLNSSQLNLASSIDIGVAPYDQGGPENEEFFSPLSAAIEKTGHGAVNEGFFRNDAQLVIILMTDADEFSSAVSPSEMAQKLVTFKSGHADKVSVYGVLVRADTPDEFKDWGLRIHPKYHEECFDMTKKNTPLLKAADGTAQCKGFGPDKLENFIVEANSSAGTPDQIRASHLMNIRSKSFGADLEVIGNAITVKTLKKEILLQQRPRTENNKLMIRVLYGNQEIPQKEDSGWLYDPTKNSIHLSGKIKYTYMEGARFTVDLIPLTLK